MEAALKEAEGRRWHWKGGRQECEEKCVATPGASLCTAARTRWNEVSWQVALALPFRHGGQKKQGPASPKRSAWASGLYVRWLPGCDTRLGQAEWKSKWCVEESYLRCWMRDHRIGETATQHFMQCGRYGSEGGMKEEWKRA